MNSHTEVGGEIGRPLKGPFRPRGSVFMTPDQNILWRE